MLVPNAADGLVRSAFPIQKNAFSLAGRIVIVILRTIFLHFIRVQTLVHCYFGGVGYPMFGSSCGNNWMLATGQQPK